MTTPTRIYDRTAFWLILFALYAIAQSAIRLHYKSSFFGDDSELFLWARELAWGYGVQPPLYAWIQWGLNQIFGDGHLSMAAMRALCLWGIYSAAFLLARRFAPVGLAGLAALGVFLVPEISQTFLRTRTHNLLVTALVPLACIAFIDLLQRRRLWDYALYGLLGGLAIIAKATGAIFLIALVLAAALMPRHRPAVLARGMLVTLVVGLVVLAGPTLWALNNPALATASLAKFEPGGGWPEGLAGLAWGLWASAGFLAVSVSLATVLTRRGAAEPMDVAVFFAAGAISLLLIAAAIVATDSAELKERWLVPIVAPLAPLALVWVMRRQGLMRFFPAALGGVAAVWMLAALPGYFRKNEPAPRADFAALAQALSAMGADRMLMTDDMAAGLALAVPGIPVAQRVDHGALPCTGTILLAAWPNEDIELDRFRARLPGCTVTEIAARSVTEGGVPIDARVVRLTPAG